MSDFYSRCLSCGVDLPRGLRFCTELCKERWHAKHDGEPVARVMTDEWPLVEREGEVKRRGAVRVVGAVEETRRGDGVSVITPTASSLPPSRLHNAGCLCKHCTMPLPF